MLTFCFHRENVRIFLVGAPFPCAGIFGRGFVIITSLHLAFQVCELQVDIFNVFMIHGQMNVQSTFFGLFEKKIQ